MVAWKPILLMAILALPLASPAAQSDDDPIVMLIEGDIWTYSADGWQQLTDFGAYNPPTLAPDGDQIAFTGSTPEWAEFVASGEPFGDTPSQTDLWIMDLPGGKPQRIAAYGDDETAVAHSRPDYSPDGSRIAWGELHVGESWFYQMAVYDRASGDVMRHSLQFPRPFGGFPQAPRLGFRNNDELVVVWPADSGMVIGAFNLEGESLSSAVELGEVFSVTAFAPLPDASVAILTDLRGWLRTDFSSESAQRMERLPAFGTDERLVAVQPASTAITLTESAIHLLPDARFSGIGIAPDGDQIAYIVEGGIAIWQDGEATIIEHPDGLTPFSLEWSPRRWFVDVPGLPLALLSTCEGAPPSILANTGAGFIYAGDGVDLYDEPGGQVISHADAGTPFTVYDGLNCDEGFMWWNVMLEDETIDWLPETIDDMYLIAPQ